MEKITFNDDQTFQSETIGDIQVKGSIEFDFDENDNDFYFVDLSFRFKNFESNYRDVGKYNTLEEAKAAVPNLVFEFLKGLFKGSYQMMSELFPNYTIV